MNKVQQFELIKSPYACFSVHLEEITFDVIQKVLEQAYCEFRANPGYLFCNEQDRKLFVTPPQYSRSKNAQEIVQLANYVTGRMMHIVALPELEQGRLLFGFFEW